jgi:rod shape determining protein RodA
MSYLLAKLKYMDKTLAVTCLLLLMLGLSVIYSTSLTGSKLIFTKQLMHGAAAAILFLTFTHLDFKAISKLSRYLYVGMVFLLIAVLLFAPPIQGSRRWFDLGFFSVQPAEFAKLIMVLVLARFFALRRGEINTWSNIVLSFVYALIPVILIAREPDLGSAIVVFAIWGGILMLSSVNKKIFVYLFLALLLFSGIAWQYLLHDYQRNRIETFLDPNLDPKGSGYNVRQAVIAVGSGGVLGQGLGRGLQSQLKFLPERQTDFIFAAAAEEFGFLGTIVIVILYFILLYRLLVIYRLSRDDLSRFTVGGIFFMLMTQVVINIGMNMGIMPVTGIPLPLFSYGGSSLFTVAMSLGIAESVAIQAKGLHLS